MAETRIPIVDVEGFKAWTSLEVPTSAESLIAARLSTYQSEAEALMKRPCEVVVTDEVVTDVVGALLVLRRRPVVSVEEIVPLAGYEITSGGNVALTQPSSGLTLTGTPRYTVSYTSRLPFDHLATVEGFIYDRMVRAYVVEKDALQGVNGVAEEGYSITLIAAGWTEAESDALKAMRRLVSR